MLWTSPPLKAGPLVYHASLCEKLKTTIRQAFLSIESESIKSLAKLSIGFVQIKPADDRDYDTIKAIIDTALPL